MGAGAGHVLAAVRAARGTPVEAWAVEPTDAGAAIQDANWVRSLDDVEPGEFDLALVLDVLEHVAQPSVLLSRVVEKVREGGTVLVSVPNVAHWSMRASLLLGRFDYQDRGITDRTHLRFFTQRTLQRLIEDVGLTVRDRGETLVPLELLLPDAATSNPLWSASRSLRRAFAHAWPGLLGYQLLVEARR